MKNNILFLLVLIFFLSTKAAYAGGGCTWATTASATSLGWNNAASWTRSGTCTGSWPFSSPLGSGDVVNINNSVTITGNVTVPNNATLRLNAGTFTVNGNVDLQNGSTFLSAIGTIMNANGNFNNSNNSTGVTVNGSINVSGNLTSGSGSTITSPTGTGAFTVGGSISGAGTVFGSTADCPNTATPCLTSDLFTLPIALLTLSADCNAEGVAINWTTASEFNNDFFQITRSYDGVNWENIYILDGAGNSTSELDYEITDQERYNGTRYYELSQVDFDGTTISYDVLSINCTYFEDNNDLSSSPNPSSGVINLSLNNLNFSGDSRILVYTLNGIEVYNKNITISSENFVYQLNDLTLESGLYFIKLTNGVASTNVLRQVIR